MSIETAALERVLARDTRVATQEILAQVSLETDAASAVLFVDRGGLELLGGLGVDQLCLDRTHSAWATSADQLREGRPHWNGPWCLWPCRTPRALALVYLAGATLRPTQVRRTVGGIARLLALLVSEGLPSEGDEAARLTQTAVDLFLRHATVEEIERRQLTMLLHDSQWNIARAARKRGVTRVTVYNWMRRLGIERLKVRRGLRILGREKPAEGGAV